MFRKIVLLAFTGGGVWLALRGMDELVRRTHQASHFNPWSGEGMLIAIPVILVGAAFGAFVGGVILPTPR